MTFTGRILALDLATVTGFAYGKPGERPKTGSVRFGRVGDPRPVSYRAYREWLRKMLDGPATVRAADYFDLVVFESPSMSVMHTGKTNVDTLKKLIGFSEHTEELCHGIVELREANVAQVRAFFLGSARIKREEAKRLTIRKCAEYGWEVGDDNAADAAALWAYQVSCLRPDIGQNMTPLFNH